MTTTTLEADEASDHVAAQGLRMNKAKLIKVICSFAAMGLLAALPPIAPLTEVGMRTIGVFVGTVLLLSLVDTLWPAILCMPLFALL